MARSKSCHDTEGSSRRKLSPSPETHRMTHERRGRRRSLDRKHGGGVDSRVSKDIHVRQRGRSKSKSPRRNSWREEIKQIKSWKDEKVIRANRFEIKRSSHSSKEDDESKRSMKYFKKNDKADKKLDSSFRSNRSSQREARLPKVSPRSPNKKTNGDRKDDSRSLSCRKARQSPLSDRRRGYSSSDRREDQLSRGKLGKKSSRWNDEELGQATRKVERTGLDMPQTQVKVMKVEYCSPTREEKTFRERTSSGDSADSDELELRISDKDVFPELRSDWTESTSTDAGVSSNDKKAAQKKSDKLSSLEIKITSLENDEHSSKRSVKLIAGRDDTDVHVRPKSMDSQSTLPHGGISDKSSAVSESLTSDGVGSSDTISSTSASSLLSEKESSAMSRSFSLLELKMEVYTTRLKELEWEREQLRKEREVLQGQELCVKRDLLKRLQKKETMRANISQLDNENKENRG